ncbi:MAG: PilZ domain-containing protein [Nitrospinota bacterium]
MDNDKRVHPRKTVDYLAEIWVREEGAEFGHDPYKDIGFRGTVKDISEGGASFHNLINLNLTGLVPAEILKKKSLIKLIMHTQGDRLQVEGELVWFCNFESGECLGVSFVGRTQ